MRLTRVFAMASVTGANLLSRRLIFNYACFQALVNTKKQLLLVHYR